MALGQPYAANRSPTPDPCSALSGSEWPQWETAYRKADDLRTRFKVPEWRVFCHTEKLRNSPLRLKLLLSDSALALALMLILGHYLLPLRGDRSA